MVDGIMIVPPQGTSDPALDTLIAELRGVGGVSGSGINRERSIDAASAAVWVQFAGSAVGVLSALVPVVAKVADLLCKRGLGKSRIVLPNGTTIEAENATAEQLSNLISKVNG